MLMKKLLRGNTPLIVSMPHVGVFLPSDVKQRMTDIGRQLMDTDWNVDRLYSFAEAMGITLLSATQSRYLVDLNRPPDDEDLYPGQVKTGLCPVQTFDGEAIYQEGMEPDNVERVNRIGAYWMPYHKAIKEEIEHVKKQFGYAMLYDAHSIKSQVPRLFDGVLPDLNLGTANGASCDEDLALAALAAAADSAYSTVLNGRFVGGYITRHYGKPADHVHAIQMELTWKNYMYEAAPYSYRQDKAAELQKTLQKVLQAMLDWGQQRYKAVVF
jgi:N-formylglutamate amidohydrolase